VGLSAPPVFELLKIASRALPTMWAPTVAMIEVEFTKELVTCASSMNTRVVSVNPVPVMRMFPPPVLSTAVEDEGTLVESRYVRLVIVADTGLVVDAAPGLDTSTKATVVAVTAAPAIVIPSLVDEVYVVVCFDLELCALENFVELALYPITKSRFQIHLN
jgi:hypothetical protein